MLLQTFSYRVLNCMNAVMQKKFLPLRSALGSAIPVLLQNKNLDTGFQNPDSKSAVEVLEITYGNVLTEFLLIHIFRYGKSKSSQKLRYIDSLSQGTKSIYISSILTLTIKLNYQCEIFWLQINLLKHFHLFRHLSDLSDSWNTPKVSHLSRQLPNCSDCSNIANDGKSVDLAIF